MQAFPKDAVLNPKRVTHEPPQLIRRPREMKLWPLVFPNQSSARTPLLTTRKDASKDASYTVITRELADVLAVSTTSNYPVGLIVCPDIVPSRLICQRPLMSCNCSVHDKGKHNKTPTSTSTSTSTRVTSFLSVITPASPSPRTRHCFCGTQSATSNQRGTYYPLLEVINGGNHPNPCITSTHHPITRESSHSVSQITQSSRNRVTPHVIFLQDSSSSS